MKNVLLVCSSFHFSKMEYKKPPFNIMKYITLVYDAQATILFDERLDSLYSDVYKVDETSHDKIELVKVDFAGYFRFLKKNARKYDLIINFHGSVKDALVINYYKKINPQGHVLTVMDHSVDLPLKKWKQLLKKMIYGLRMKKFIRNTDLFTVETEKSFTFFKNNSYYGKKINVSLMPFGFCPDDFADLDLAKEDLLISVGRIGSMQKNTLGLLESLKDVKFNNFRIALVGPVEEDFRKTLDEYLRIYDGKLLYLGVINNSKELAKLYARSKGFILTSIYESFALVVLESAIYNNYLISSNCGVGPDLINKYHNGVITNDYAKEINYFIDNNITVDVKKEIRDNYNWTYLIENNSLLKEILEEKENGRG